MASEMKLGTALSLALAAAAAALVPLSAGAARAKTIHFKVVSGTASATLTFHTANTAADETSDGKIVLTASPKRRGSGSVPGRATFALKGKVSEKVTTRTQVSGTSPYQETCSRVRKVAGRGGLTLKRVGTKVQVGWAFPQAKPSFCRGPKAGEGITARMKRLYPSKMFNGKRVTVVLSGSAKVPGESSSVSYRWHAVVKLARS
jgi:hypothetical protein